MIMNKEDREIAFFLSLVSRIKLSYIISAQISAEEWIELTNAAALLTEWFDEKDLKSFFNKMTMLCTKTYTSP